MHRAYLAIEAPAGQIHAQAITRYYCIGRSYDVSMIIAGDSIPAFECLQRADRIERAPGVSELLVGVVQARAHGGFQAPGERFALQLLRPRGVPA